MAADQRSPRHPISVRAAADTRDVATDWRIRDVRTGEVFNIRAIEVTPNRQYVDLLVESGVAV
ncbi:head-tail adaptor protein [Nitratireductor indicus]|nr:head-tail adaptor protein [Nitratireductor indicus]